MKIAQRVIVIDSKQVYQYSKDLNILYVEDDLDLKEATLEIFKDFFKTVQSAVDGVDALNKYNEFYEKNGKHFDIVVTDIEMVKMTGIELIKEIHIINKDQEIIVVSAYSD